MSGEASAPACQVQRGVGKRVCGELIDSQFDAVVVAVPPALVWGHPRSWAPVPVPVFAWRSALLYVHVPVQWLVHNTDRSQKLDSPHCLHLYVVSLSFLLLVVQGPWPVC